MANTKAKAIKNNEWFTYHSNGPYLSKTLLKTTLANAGDEKSKYNDATIEIRRLLQESINTKQRFRAVGNNWSMCDIMVCKDQLQDNSAMSLKWQMQQSEIHKSSTYEAEHLFFLQCGNNIKQTSNFMFKYNKSIKTSGASNKQTIGGAISTGIHGSSIEVGSFQDAVVGLQLIIGPDAADVVYIERATKPALSDAYVATINARVIRDDDLFNAALVGLGSFGFIHGVVMETEDLFLLKRYTRLIDRTKALDLVAKLGQPSSDSFLTGTDVDAKEGGVKPFHYKLYVNPYNSKEKFLMEIIYKKTYRTGYPNPIPFVQTFVYKELPDLMAMLAAKYSHSIPLLMAALKSSIFPAPDVDTEGMLSEIFYDSFYQGEAFAISLGIDHTQMAKGLETFLNVCNTIGPVPGAIGIRFVKGTKATLGFTKFPLTCILEMDGLLWTKKDKIVSLLEFETKLHEAFRIAKIPFTLHWGKNMAWGNQGLVDEMYGAADEAWKIQRSKLLTKQMADIFSNDFLTRTKLADYMVVPAMLAAKDLLAKSDEKLVTKTAAKKKV